MKAGHYNKVTLNAEGKIIGAATYDYNVQEYGMVSYFNLTGTEIEITAISDGTNNFIKIECATALENEYNFDNGGTNNSTLRYTGSKTKVFSIDASISLSPQVGALDTSTYIFAIAKNETVIQTTRVIFSQRTPSDINPLSVHALVELELNDEINVYVANLTGVENVIVKSIVIVANG